MTIPISFSGICFIHLLISLPESSSHAHRSNYTIMNDPGFEDTTEEVVQDIEDDGHDREQHATTEEDEYLDPR